MLSGVDQKKQAELVKACFRNDCREIERLVNSEGTDINAVNFIDTPLTAATKQGHLEATKLLCRLGADIHCNGDYNPLFWGVIKRHNEIVKFLLSVGADSNTVVDGIPVLHYAASWGWSDIVVTLLEHHADPNQLDTCGRTALHHATDLMLYFGEDGVQDPITVIEILLDKLKEETIADNEGNLPLHYFVQRSTIVPAASFLRHRKEELSDEVLEKEISAEWDRIYLVYRKLFFATKEPFHLNKEGQSFDVLLCKELETILNDVWERGNMAYEFKHERDEIADFIIKYRSNKKECPETRELVPTYAIQREQIFLHRRKIL